MFGLLLDGGVCLIDNCSWRQVLSPTMMQFSSVLPD
jgi:hypothetical protein